MNLAVAALAAVAVGGAVVAASARDPRAAVLGILVVLLAAPLVADPWPGPLAILARMAAALLAGRFLAIGIRGVEPGTGNAIGWPAQVLLAGAAAVAGFASHGLGSPGLGPVAAQATAFALVALAAAPLVLAGDVLRLGVGAILLVQSGLLVRVALDQPMTDGEQLVVGLLTIALGGAVAVIARAGRSAGAPSGATEGATPQIGSGLRRARRVQQPGAVAAGSSDRIARPARVAR